MRQRLDEVRFVTHSPGTDERDAEPAQFLPQFLDPLGAGVAARPAVHRNQPVHAGGESLVGPLSFGHVVVHDAADGVRLLDHPLRVAEGGHEEADPFFERHIHPVHHPLVIGLRGRLDERVHADRFAGQPLDEAEPFAELVAMDIGERNRLHDAEAAGIGHRRDELGIAAGVHGAADERHLDAGVFRERGAGHYLTPFPLLVQKTREARKKAGNTENRLNVISFPWQLLPRFQLLPCFPRILSGSVTPNQSG